MKVILQNSRQNWIQEWGGDSTQVIETAKALQELGVDVEIEESHLPVNRTASILHIFNIQTSRWGRALVEDAIRRNVTVVLSPIYWDFRHVDKIAHKWFPGLYDHKIRWLAHMHPEVAYGMRRLYLRRSYIRWLSDARYMLEQAAYVMPNSVAELEIIVRLFEMPSLRARSGIVVNGATISAETAIERPIVLESLPEEFVLQVGTFHPVKGQIALLQAMMSTPSIPIVLVGRGIHSAYGKECRRLADARGNTTIVDHVSPSEVSWFYKRARVHVLPSLRESPGLATLEAAAHGCQCVVSIHGPVVEYFGQDAWYCDPSDTASILSAVTGAWSCTTRATRLQRRVLETYTWANVARQTLTGYRMATTYNSPTATLGL